jgi:hypothetical protein
MACFTHHCHPGIVVRVYGTEALIFLDERVGAEGAECTEAVSGEGVCNAGSVTVGYLVSARGLCKICGMMEWGGVAYATVPT